MRAMTDLTRDFGSDQQPCDKGVLVQTLNPMTGQREWKMVPEDYDYQQEVARAAFADMLHDSERVSRLHYRFYLCVLVVKVC